MSAQMRDDYAVALRDEDWRNFDVVIDVVRPVVEQDHGGARRRSGLGITDIERTGVDLLAGANDVLDPALIAGSCGGLVWACAAPITPSLGGSKGERSSAEKAAAILVKFVTRLRRIHSLVSHNSHSRGPSRTSRLPARDR